MGQSFQYPNIVAGTRDHMSKDTYNNLVQPVPLAAAPSGMAYALVNATAKENFLWTPYMSDLRPGTRYTLSVWMAKTDNCDSADIFVIDTDGRYDATLVALKVKPPSGGGCTPCPYRFRTHIGLVRTTESDSTTTGARTARIRRSGSRTSCSARARSRAPGRRRKVRCGHER